MLNQYRRPSTDHPLDERVAALLEAAAAPTEPGPQPGEDAALAAFRASPETTRRIPMRSPLTPRRTAAAAALSVGLLVTGGFGAAAAGALPDAAQAKAQEWLAALEIDVPGPDEASAGHADERGESDAVDGEDVAATSSEHGQAVAGFATSGELRGAELAEFASSKGQEAREGAGENGGAGQAPAERPGGSSVETPPTQGEPAEKPPVDSPPVETPDSGDTGSGDSGAGDAGTGDDASSGESSVGTDRAGAGAGNAP